MKKTGYHYTSKENWEKIKKEGLIPQLIYKKEVDEYCPGAKAVWIWEKKLKGDEHLGTLLFQLQKTKKTKIVVLMVKYNDYDRLSFEGTPIKIFHEGEIGEWRYHDDAPARLITKVIPPKDIKKIKEYDFIKLTK